MARAYGSQDTFTSMNPDREGATEHLRSYIFDRVSDFDDWIVKV